MKQHHTSLRLPVDVFVRLQAQADSLGVPLADHLRERIGDSLARDDELVALRQIVDNIAVVRDEIIAIKDEITATVAVSDTTRERGALIEILYAVRNLQTPAKAQATQGLVKAEGLTPWSSNPGR